MKVVLSALLGLGIVISLGGCTRDKVLAEVGEYKVTEKDVNFREQAIRALNPTVTQVMGGEQLIRAYTLAEILKKAGKPITEQVLEAEGKRFDSMKFAGGKNDDLKKVYGKDRQAFYRTYILPMLVERSIYQDVFMKDESLQKPFREKADGFLADVIKTPDKFDDLGKKNSFQLSRGTLTVKEGLSWDQERQSPTSVMLPRGPVMGQIWSRDYFKTLGNGKVYGKLVEYGSNWLVLRNLGPKGTGMGVEVAVIPRPNFGQWLEDQKKSVSVKRMNTAKS